MNNTKSKRKTVFIKRGFQMKFIYWVIGMLAVCCLCSAGVLYPMMSSEVSSGMTSGHLDIGGVKNNLLFAILIGNGLAIIVAALATTVVILYITHKIAGPLYRFEGVCEEIGNGNLNVSTGLRSKDQLEGLSDAFRGMLTQLRDRRKDQHTRLEMARSELNSLPDALTDQSASRKILESVNGQLELLAGEMEEGAKPGQVSQG
jgi:methyl-accepting chemotaxis protein